MDDALERLVSRLSEEHAANVERLTRIEAGVVHLDECMDGLKKKLFGNGQPGVIEVMSSRITDIEKWVWRTTGILAAGFGVVNFVLVILQYGKR